MPQYVGLYPNKWTIDNIKHHFGNENDLYPDHKFHCTLRYWDCKSHNDMISYNFLQFPHFLEGVETKAMGIEMFGNCLVMLLEPTEQLLYLQKSVDKIVQKQGAEEHPYLEWRPHITLCKNPKKIPTDFPKENIQLDVFKFVEKKDNDHNYLFVRPLF